MRKMGAVKPAIRYSESFKRSGGAGSGIGAAVSVLAQCSKVCILRIVKATLTELHRKTAKVLKPVLEGDSVIITHHGSEVAEIRPRRKANYKRMLQILRSMGPIELPPRK